MKNNVTLEEVYDFLIKVDTLFPISLSEKQDLKTFYKKLITRGTLCVATDEGKIISIVGGYTKNIIDNKPYILEMNARFGGGYPFSHMGGCNLPKAIVEWCKGNDVPDELFSVQTGNIGYKELFITKI